MTPDTTAFVWRCFTCRATLHSRRELRRCEAAQHQLIRGREYRPAVKLEWETVGSRFLRWRGGRGGVLAKDGRFLGLALKDDQLVALASFAGVDAAKRAVERFVLRGER